MRTLVGLLVMTLYQIGSLVVTDDYIASAEYANRNYFVKQFLLGLWGQLTLMKYISVWLIAEGVRALYFSIDLNSKQGKNISNSFLITNSFRFASPLPYRTTAKILKEMSSGTRATMSW